MTSPQDQNKPKSQELKEEILWHRILQTGIFRKKVIEALVVTDQRVIKELPHRRSWLPDILDCNPPLR